MTLPELKAFAEKARACATDPLAMAKLCEDAKCANPDCVETCCLCDELCACADEAAVHACCDKVAAK